MRTLLGEMSAVCRRKHYSLLTERTYISWTKRYMAYHDIRLPVVMSKDEVALVLDQIPEDLSLMVELLYGSGLRPICSNQAMTSGQCRNFWATRI